MKKILLLLLPIYLLLASFMQPGIAYDSLPESNKLQQQGDSIYLPMEVDTLPMFPGGHYAYTQFIREHIVYPSQAKQDTVFGNVYISFVIWSDGSIGRVHAIRSPNKLLSAEAIRVIKAMPNWKPAKRNHIPVACQLILPIYFELR